MTFLLPLLKTFWAPVALALLLGLGYVGFEAEQARVEHAQAQTVKAQGELRQANLSIDNLKGQIGDQNKAIDNLIATAATLKAQRDHLLDVADKAGVTVVTKFVTQYKPVPVGATCALAVAAGAVNAAQIGQLYGSH